MKADKHGAFKAGVAGLVIGLLGAAVLFRALGIVGVLLVLPLVAWGASRVFVDMTHSAIARIGDGHLEEWEGAYYEFAGIHVRIYEIDGRLWFVAADIIKALNIEANARLLASAKARKIAGTGLPAFTADTAEAFVLAHAPQDAARFVNWMKRDVVAAWERKKSGALAAR
jgi:hypothetical protein